MQDCGVNKLGVEGSNLEDTVPTLALSGQRNSTNSKHTAGMLITP
jgi:hypothetical protein